MSESPIDITKLSGAALFEALASGRPLQMPKKHKPLPKTVDNLAPLCAQHWSWADTSLVLIETEVTCDCGQIYCYPNNTLFLRREASDGTLHYTALANNIPNPEERFRTLPCHVEVRQESCRACRFCFDLAHVIERARCTTQEQAIQNVVPVKRLPEPPPDLNMPFEAPFEILEILPIFPQMEAPDA